MAVAIVQHSICQSIVVDCTWVVVIPLVSHYKCVSQTLEGFTCAISERHIIQLKSILDK